MRISFFDLVWVSVIALAGSAASQMISSKDLPMFVGSFAIPDPQRPDSFDLSKFAEWYIDSADTNGHRYSFGAGRPVETNSRQWLALITEGQNPEVCNDVGESSDYSDYLFYIMSDLHGFMDRWDALTVWRRTPRRDSVEFIAAQFGFGTSIGRSWVERVTIFPDGSLLLHTKCFGADDETWGGDSFLRGDSLFSFQLLWSSNWESDELKRTYVIADRLCYPATQIIEVTEFMRQDASIFTFEGPALRAESVSAVSIDLWQLAQSKMRTPELPGND